MMKTMRNGESSLFLSPVVDATLPWLRGLVCLFDPDSNAGEDFSSIGLTMPDW